jgi:hypothetical protein
VGVMHGIRIFGDGSHMTVGFKHRVACRGWESMHSLELADIALGAAAIIMMFALLLVSMPGWH